MKKPSLTHFDAAGAARMVDVSAKPVTNRSATAAARVVMQPATLALIQSGQARKGDVLGTARLAGIMAAKRTSDLIPLCHPLPITAVQLDLQPVPPDAVEITATVRTTGQTGVEMEALTAASIAALTIYDMCKAVDRAMRIDGLRLLKKSGGASGNWTEKEGQGVLLPQSHASDEVVQPPHCSQTNGDLGGLLPSPPNSP